MKSTLRAFQSVLSQIACSGEAAVAPRALVIGGLLAAALAAPSAASDQRFSARLTPGEHFGAGATVDTGGPAADKGEGISESAAKNIGRVVGGVAGYALGRANNASSAVTALLAGLGVVGGGLAAEHLHGGDRAEGRAKGAGKVLPADINARFRTLTIEAAAWRYIAQQRLVVADDARLRSVTAPRDVELAVASARAEQRLNVALLRNRAAFQDMRGAVKVASDQGFDVSGYAQSLAELAPPVDAKHVVKLDELQVVRDRAAHLEASILSVDAVASSAQIEREMARGYGRAAKENFRGYGARSR